MTHTVASTRRDGAPRPVRGLGVTISARQAEWARARVAADGLGDRVEIRLQDYREVADGPFDAVSSIGMFQHVGLARLGEYFDRLHGLLRPGGRLLNHAISRRPAARTAIARRSFMGRYVFPDAQLHELGGVVTAMQVAGFEARHLESLREHYARTLRAWSDNLERNWDAAVAEVGPGRTRVWRLYVAGSALAFDDARIGIDQVLAVRPDRGRSAMGWRPSWDPAPTP
jgi:cyclopropane-fatty-acyl-phospholipid synthase